MELTSDNLTRWEITGIENQRVMKSTGRILSGRRDKSVKNEIFECKMSAYLHRQADTNGYLFTILINEKHTSG